MVTNNNTNHIHAIKTEQDTHWDPITPTSMDNAAHYATINGIIPVKLTHWIVQQQPDWEQWEKLEFKQHNAYEAQDMFGQPMPPPK